MFREKRERDAKAWSHTNELLALIFDRLGVIGTPGYGFKRPPEPLRRPYETRPKGLSALGFIKAVAAAA